MRAVLNYKNVDRKVVSVWWDSDDTIHHVSFKNENGNLETAFQRMPYQAEGVTDEVLHLSLDRRIKWLNKEKDPTALTVES